ncbi:hypothetical protein [Legionella jordanis]|uniref:Uncharacterized protein n=1 Tax=Legionella jordanis TaxID=456 RepID=A0A0W0V8D9_9GAMM|nr:hypothetical protein [Legionella jordanis]KTD16380.1 hypothetical protein Ljor_0686 [Legionella jordanis]RMX04412.1 hypothetical protein EAW55_02965 [Legionella jordanis]RMX14998.1 hypothetical protein EAS68_13155 [Legionella jordanis]VEH12160.1 Uncharacterised protein [Legionella jordanis]HAT8715095.1 hypothetical protein [Legionella jordanis]
MQEKFEYTTPPSSPRTLEEQRLRRETNGIFAPAAPGFFDKTRKKLVEDYVREGLEKFDAQQSQDDEAIVAMEIDRIGPR